MAKYIEREELMKKAIKERRFVFQMEDLLNSEVIFKTVYKDLAEFINSIPAADVAPVRHGRWSKFYKSGNMVEEGFVSSCCDMWNERRSPFCPNCGCKMDGDQK